MWYCVFGMAFRISRFHCIRSYRVLKNFIDTTKHVINIVLLHSLYNIPLSGIRHVVPGPPKVEVLLPVFLCGPDGRVADCAPPVPERYWPGATVGEHSASGGPPTLSVILPKYVRFAVVPCQGLHVPGKDPNQPPDSLHAPLHAVHYCDSLGR